MAIDWAKVKALLCQLRCRQRGVLFDAGHGQGSFDWDVVEAAARVGFYPDLISTDLHTGNLHGAVRDLTNVASKFLLAGMPIKDVRFIWSRLTNPIYQRRLDCFVPTGKYY